MIVSEQPGNLVELGHAILPMLEGKLSEKRVATAYVCRNYACKQPVTESAALAEQLAQ